jgi:acyl carrier protein
MSDTKMFDLIIKIIGESEDLEPLIPLADIKPETLIQEDLGFDSLALMSIVYELQEIYEDLDETEMANWNTISDIADKLKEYNA